MAIFRHEEQNFSKVENALKYLERLYNEKEKIGFRIKFDIEYSNIHEDPFNRTTRISLKLFKNNRVQPIYHDVERVDKRVLLENSEFIRRLCDMLIDKKNIYMEGEYMRSCLILLAPTIRIGEHWMHRKFRQSNRHRNRNIEIVTNLEQIRGGNFLRKNRIFIRGAGFGYPERTLTEGQRRNYEYLCKEFELRLKPKKNGKPTNHLLTDNEREISAHAGNSHSIDRGLINAGAFYPNTNRWEWEDDNEEVLDTNEEQRLTDIWRRRWAEQNERNIRLQMMNAVAAGNSLGQIEATSGQLPNMTTVDDYANDYLSEL